MIVRVTSFTCSQQPEGMRVTYTYSVIDEEGKVIKQNVRDTCIVMDEATLNNISTLQKWVFSKI